MRFNLLFTSFLFNLIILLNLLYNLVNIIHFFLSLSWIIILYISSSIPTEISNFSEFNSINLLFISETSQLRLIFFKLYFWLLNILSILSVLLELNILIDFEIIIWFVLNRFDKYGSFRPFNRILQILISFRLSQKFWSLIKIK